MHSSQHDDAHAVAVFRYGLIADLLHLPRGSNDIAALLRAKAERTYQVPRSQRCHVAAETMRHWLKLYRAGGFEALLPKRRADVGVSKTLPSQVADMLCQIKEDRPELSVQLVIKAALATGKIPEGLPLPASTVHRLLSRARLMRRKPVEPAQDRRRFTFEHGNDLWMSDVMHGPTVGVGGKVRRKAYLIGFLDDATRVVPYAAFALSENAATFLPQLQQAIMRRGVPKRLYVDNGSAYRSQHLQLVCARLGITLIHARPYHPEGKGKQERFFRTVRLQFLPTLGAQDTQSLQAINARLWAWVEGEYHHSPHRGLEGLTPLDAWAARSAHVEHVGGRGDIDALFLAEAHRKVAKDRTLSLAGTMYEVDAVLIGARVTLRYPCGGGGPIQVYSANGERFADARLLDALGNRLVKRDNAPAEGLAMRALRDGEGRPCI